MSFAEPAGNGTMILTARDGQSLKEKAALGETAMSANANRTADRNRCIRISWPPALRCITGIGLAS
jgi:hypothetical protein